MQQPGFGSIQPRPEFGVAGDLALPTQSLLALVPAALVIAAAVAVLPALRAARLRPAEVLRAD